MRLCLLVLVLSPCVLGDVYMHNPRGSNNRLDESSAQRKNANRLFDSQNNARGGYNVGDRDSDPAENNADKQYQMKYFQSGYDGGSSYLDIEWTNQHGCGANTESDPHKVNCNMVLQYMCTPDDGTPTGEIRDGVQANTQDYSYPLNLDESQKKYQVRSNKAKNARGQHERFMWMDKCFVRERNNNLYSADQDIKPKIAFYGKPSAKYASACQTRQNPNTKLPNNGNRFGYECPEERDYYPYWHPSPWKDIAVRTYDESLCDFYQANSFNVRPYHECVLKRTDDTYVHFSRYNNEDDCINSDPIGNTEPKWQEFHNYLEILEDVTTEAECGDLGDLWAVPAGSTDMQKRCLVKLEAPVCEEAEWTRTNHLGNSRDGKPTSYKWKLPHFPSGYDQRCVLRIRYNITTDDYNPWAADASHDDILVHNNPDTLIGNDKTLQLNVNTAQFGRTFQDRSHVFILRERPSEISPSVDIYNLNVRGKRGNIVQTFPAVEYDFIPNDLQVTTKDLIHIQWTGSNTHDNNDPAGDGQSGDAGQGKDGTDRHNLVQISEASVNRPLTFDQTVFQGGEFDVVWASSGSALTGIDIALQLATSGFWDSSNNAPGKNAQAELDADLDGAAASYGGVVLRANSGGIFHYMCSRNNAFSNRSQKGKITVTG